MKILSEFKFPLDNNHAEYMCRAFIRKGKNARSKSGMAAFSRLKGIIKFAFLDQGLRNVGVLRNVIG